LFTLIENRKPSVKKIGKLIRKGVDFYAISRQGFKSLDEMEKTDAKLLDIVSFLITNGANLDSNYDKYSLLSWSEQHEGIKNWDLFPFFSNYEEKEYEIKDFLGFINLFVKYEIDSGCHNVFQEITLLGIKLSINCAKITKTNYLIDIIRL
jgi:hypothetical protein